MSDQPCMSFPVPAGLSDLAEVRVPADLARDVLVHLRALAHLSAAEGAPVSAGRFTHLADQLEAAARRDLPRPLTREELLEEVGLRR